MKTIDFSHFIERYISGEMGSDEKEWFEKELEGNEKLRAEVKLRKSTEIILRDQDLLALRKKLAAIEKARRESTVVSGTTKRPSLIRYAAVIAALAVIGSVLWFTGKGSSGGDITSQYYKTYEPPTSQRSGSNTENADFTLALEFYNTNDYANAAKFFSKVVENNPKDMQSVLLNGVSNFEDKRYPEAKKSFVTVIDDDNNLFIETAKWYLALCYIKTEEYEKAVSQLQVISEEGGIYSRDARKMIRKIK